MNVKSTDLVLIVFTHNWDAITSDDYEADDILDISIVHRPDAFSYENYLEETIRKMDHDPACNGGLPNGAGAQIVPRKFVNMRNVRKCQRASCFGGKK